MTYKRTSRTSNGIRYTTHHNRKTGIRINSQSTASGGLRITTNNFGETYHTYTTLDGYVSRRKVTKGYRHTLTPKKIRTTSNRRYRSYSGSSTVSYSKVWNVIGWLVAIPAWVLVFAVVAAIIESVMG
jgi:hypothetical protein